MTKRNEHSVIIKMGAAHSSLEFDGSVAPLPTDLKGKWELGTTLSTIIGAKGPTPKVTANAKRKGPQAHGKPHNRKGKPPARPDQDKPRGGHAPKPVLDGPHDDGAKKPRRRRRKPRAVPATGQAS